LSTRCNIVFTDGDEHVARIYQHSDGYPGGPNGVPATLERFFAEMEAAGDDLGDTEIVAALFVWWKFDQDRHDVVGIMRDEPHGDEEYVYTVDCSTAGRGKRPTVTVASL
jgi:hypothetical protein